MFKKVMSSLGVPGPTTTQHSSERSAQRTVDIFTGVFVVLIIGAVAGSYIDWKSSHVESAPATETPLFMLRAGPAYPGVYMELDNASSKVIDEVSGTAEVFNEFGTGKLVDFEFRYVEPGKGRSISLISHYDPEAFAYDKKAKIVIRSLYTCEVGGKYYSPMGAKGCDSSVGAQQESPIPVRVDFRQ